MTPRRAKDKIKRIWAFATDEVWDIELSTLSALKGLWIRAVRVVHLVLRGFRDDECPLHASALTFSTLMAVIPVLALSLAVARGFEGDAAAKEWARHRLQDWTSTFKKQEPVRTLVPDEHVLDSVVETGVISVFTPGSLEPQGLDPADLEELLDAGFEQVSKIKFGALGGMGLALLLWMVVQVLGRIEASFNRVWGVVQSRSLLRCFTDYIFAVLIIPVLVIAASSLPVTESLVNNAPSFAAHGIRVLVESNVLKNIAVFLLTGVAFSFIIMFMPNTKVKMIPGLTGGMITGGLFLMWLTICATLQVGVAKYGAFYGSFAIVPILLAWVFVSWEIILFGAEVSFSIQNCATYKMEQGARRASFDSRLRLSLSVLTEAARAMDGEIKGFRVSEFASKKIISVRFINDVVDELKDAGYLASLESDSESLVLLKTPENITVKSIVTTLLNSGVPASSLGMRSIDAGVEEALKRIGSGYSDSLGSTTLRDLEKAAIVS